MAALDLKNNAGHAQSGSDTSKGNYVSPTVLRLGRLEEQTQSTFGNRADFGVPDIAWFS